MEITKSAIFLHHRDAQEALQQERKYTKLYRLGWAGTLILWSPILVAGLFFQDSSEYSRNVSAMALLLGPLASISMLMAMIYTGKAVDATKAIRGNFFVLALVLGMSEEELCSQTPADAEKTGKMLILNQAVNIQIFEDSVKELKVTASAYLSNRIHDHLADDKAQMKERLNGLHKALSEFTLTAINYNWAFEEARKIRS